MPTPPTPKPNATTAGSVTNANARSTTATPAQPKAKGPMPGQDFAEDGWYHTFLGQPVALHAITGTTYTGILTAITRYTLRLRRTDSGREVGIFKHALVEFEPVNASQETHSSTEPKEVPSA